MADNYSQTSMEVLDLNELESKWLSEEYVRIQIPTDDIPEQPKRSSPWGKIDEDFYHVGYASFEMTIEEGTAWIMSEDNFDIDQLGEFLMRFLKKFRPKERISFTWADTCSKMRVDEFRGGTALVTSRRISVCDGGCLLRRGRAIRRDGQSDP